MPARSATIKIPASQFDAIIFDMDGVLTQTASTHASAWKEVFDQFLESRFGENFEPFDIQNDYRRYVDGKPRYDGVRSFLESRGIDLPEGDREDSGGFESVRAIGNLKNKMFLQQVEKNGVESYSSTVELIDALKKSGIKTAAITSSENGSFILERTKLLDLFDAVVDGKSALEFKLKGKPHPDIFLKAAELLGVKPSRAVVVEDAAAGVKAGKKGHFGLVVGVDRGGNAGLLKEHGADRVVDDLSELSLELDKCRERSDDVSAEDSDLRWVISYNRFDPRFEGQHEALCAIGNGYFVTRAAAPESVADGIHYPGTYLAGLYNRLTTRVQNRELEHEDLVNLPNWQYLTFRIEDGDWFDLESVEIKNYRQYLNLRQGILNREIDFVDRKGRHTRLKERRFVHLRHFHLAGIEFSIEPLNWSGRITVKSALDGRIENSGARSFSALKKKHLVPVDRGVNDDVLFLKMRTSQSRVEVSQTATLSLHRDGVDLLETEDRRDSHETVKDDYVALETSIAAREKEPIVVRKVAAMFSSRDHAISESGSAALEAVAGAPSFEKLIEDQIEAWNLLWQHFDLNLEILDDDSSIHAALVLHLHIFHVLQTASPNSIDLDIGIPARGWTGEAYQGHVFWDDLFVFPFLNLRMPEIARSILKYRFRRLNKARELAGKFGGRGARFPWQSGSDGNEETPELLYFADIDQWAPDSTYLQVHVNAAIVYNIWHYYQSTGDLEFINVYGAEIILEIARHLASIAILNQKRDRYEIHKVVGPDEYHVAYPGASEPGINNNAYTNVMSVWVLSRALELFHILSDDKQTEIRLRLDLSAEEIEHWRQVSKKMFVPFIHDGIINQFEGFEKLEDFPSEEDGNVDHKEMLKTLRKQGGHLNRYKITKQLDVLMLFYLFSFEELQELFEQIGYRFSEDMISKNVAYYCPITSHDSTLSRVALAWVLSRLDRSESLTMMWDDHGKSCKKIDSNRSLIRTKKEGSKSKLHSWAVFLEALGSDYFDIQGGTTREGIHMGAMAGTIDIVQRCFTGIVVRDNVLWFNPRLPKMLPSLCFNLHYRKQSIDIEITQKTLRVVARKTRTDAVKIGFGSDVYELHSGETLEFDLETKKHKPKAA